MEKALKKYIDSLSADGKEEVRPLLQQTSSIDRYSLLMNVRGDKFSGNTGPHIAANYNDLETMKYMLEGFTVDEKYDVLKIQGGNGLSVLHCAAWRGYSSIITYLLTDLSQQQKYNLLKLQDKDGVTPLHYAARNNHSSIITYLLTDFSQQQKYNLLQLKNKGGNTPIYDAASKQKSEAIQAILTSLSPQQQIQLLNIKNKEGQSVTDIIPEVYKEHPLMISLGNVIYYN